MSARGSQSRIDRRRFLRSAAGAGAVLALGPVTLAQPPAPAPSDQINVALIGAGNQGKVLTEAARRIEGVRFRAVCDIWSFNRKWASRRLKAYGHPCNAYEDIGEMLARERDLDAVLIATPDFWHAPHTVACLDAGLHVYCEKEMSNTLEGARQMVEAARKSGRLLQIGHQRRSNPLYVFCREKLLHEVALLGQIVAVNGQWNRAARAPRGWPKHAAIDQATLKKYGYESMHQFRNWRWYKGLGGGPIVDLGSHQIDVYNWFLDARPVAVLASGRTNYYDKKTHEWYDTVMAVYEYDTAAGPVSASYQTLSANGNRGYFEKFMGHQGTLIISERSSLSVLYPEPLGDDAIAWARCLKQGYLTAAQEVMEMVDRMSLQQLARAFNVAPTPLPVVSGSAPAATASVLSCQPAVTMDKLVHQPHLENFFDAIRGAAELTCSAEVGYETAVTVLKVNQAVEAGRKLHFQPGEFTV